MRAEAERKAVNTTIQGTAADVMKRAMLDWCRWQEGAGQPPVRIVAQVSCGWGRGWASRGKKSPGAASQAGGRPSQEAASRLPLAAHVPHLACRLATAPPWLHGARLCALPCCPTTHTRAHRHILSLPFSSPPLSCLQLHDELLVEVDARQVDGAWVAQVRLLGLCVCLED